MLKNKQYLDSVNILYLLINKVFRYISEENGEKFLTIHKENSEKYNRVLSIVKSDIMSKEGKEIVYDNDFNKIQFFSNSTNLPSEKLIYFSTLTVVIRCVIKKDNIFYPQAYLENCYYKNDHL